MYVTTHDEARDYLIDEGCSFFAVFDSDWNTSLCTSNERGDMWALRYANEDDSFSSPVVQPLDDLPLPWVILELDSMSGAFLLGEKY